MTACVICGGSFELSERLFEQRLIEDRDFCSRCWKEIMMMEYQSDAQEIIAPQMAQALAYISQ